MIKHFWGSVAKWQKLWEEVCQEKKDEESWDYWFGNKVCKTCGYCREAKLGHCERCPLQKDKICTNYSITKGYLINKLYKACLRNHYGKIVVYTWGMLQAVSDPKYMGWFRKKK